jgi:hypothetical protein
LAAVQPQGDAIGKCDGIKAHVAGWSVPEAQETAAGEVLGGSLIAELVFDIGAGDLNEGLEEVAGLRVAPACVP